jgi:hypothetical protein
VVIILVLKVAREVLLFLTLLRLQEAEVEEEDTELEALEVPAEVQEILEEHLEELVIALPYLPHRETQVEMARVGPQNQLEVVEVPLNKVVTKMEMQDLEQQVLYQGHLFHILTEEMVTMALLLFLLLQVLEKAEEIILQGIQHQMILLEILVVMMGW